MHFYKLAKNMALPLIYLGLERRLGKVVGLERETITGHGMGTFHLTPTYVD